MKPTTRNLLLGSIAAALLPFSASAAVINIQPQDESTSKDTKIYKNVPDGYFVSNIDVSADFSGMVQFDLSSLAGVTPSTISTAVITLYCRIINTAGFVAVRAMTSPWLELSSTGNSFDGGIAETNLATYNNVFGDGLGNGGTITTGSILNSVNVNAVGFVDFDITDLVKSWLTTPSSNNGVLFTGVGTTVSVGFADVDSNTATNAPKLTVTTIPEPTSAVLLGVAGCGLLMRRRRSSS